jgi:formylglycine-generating enzyme required for sulfatase activity
MKKTILLLLLLGALIASRANNITISNVSIINNGPGNIMVQFDMSWENSWRVVVGPNNYDGGWVFFKYKNANGDWVHLTLTGANNSVPAAAEIFQNSGGIKYGAVISRSSANPGIGNVSFTGIRLGVVNTLPYNIDIRAYALEMVYIPTNANVVLGDGDGVTEAFKAFHVTDNQSASFPATFKTDLPATSINDAIITGAGVDIQSSGIGGNASWVTGQAFWSMKYELSEAGYRDFLNALNLTQQTTRTANSPTSATGTSALSANNNNRQYIEIATPSTGGLPAVYGCDANNNNIYNEAADGEWTACGFLSYPDHAAYLDWAGLSLLNEVMYERICRGATSAGANASVSGEYAWGTNTVVGFFYSYNNPSQASEVPSNASTTIGNAVWVSTGDLFGAGRTGIFATGTTNRVTSGSAFFGVMEMSGNEWENCVCVGTVAGRSFLSTNGDGVLSANGNANTSSWPCSNNSGIAASCSEVLDAGGIIARGGSLNSNFDFLQISKRQVSGINVRQVDNGARGVLYIN